MSRGRTRAARRGFTLVEIAVSILLSTIVITAAMMARYNSVRQARRADAYNGAGRLALLLLEGWRSYASPDLYTPLTNFTDYFDTFEGGTGPDEPTGFQVLGGYHIELDHVHYYVTLAYLDVDPTAIPPAPAKLHAAVAFRHQYQEGYDEDEVTIVRLTTYD